MISQSQNEDSSRGAEGERADSGLTKCHDGRLESLAIRKGWITSDRWPTRMPREQLAERIEENGGETVIDRAVMAVFDLLDGSERAKGIGARTAVAMEHQNQLDEHKDQPDEVNVNVYAKILEDPDFYGNAEQIAAIEAELDARAKHSTSKSDEASNTTTGESGQIQADGMRPPLGKNGSRSHRDD